MTRRPVTAALLVAGLSLLARADALDRADADPWPFLSTRADEADDRDPAEPVGNLVVRPNQTVAFHAYVRNPGDQDWTKLRLVLAADAAGSDVLAEGAIDRVKAGKTAAVKLTFKKSVPPAPPPAADKPAVAPPAARLGGRVYLMLFDTATVVPEPFHNPKAPAGRLVRVPHPREYLTAVAEVRGPVGAAGGFSLDVTVAPSAAAAAAGIFRGPACRVKLDLRPHLLPGLDPDGLKAGTFEGVLEPAGKGAALRAEGVRLGAAVGTPDRFFVTADGYERAFWFEADFRTAGNVLTPVTDRGYLGLDVPRFAVPGKPLPVRVEVAGREPLGEPHLLFHRTPVGDPEGVTAGLPGPRDVRVSARVGDAGELLVGAEVKDWLLPVETAGVFGTRSLTLGVGSAAAEARVTLDATGPTGLRFRNLPKTALRGKPLTLTADGQDPESGVSRVVFYLGEPPADGKPLPPGKAAVGVRRPLPAARPDAQGPPPAADGFRGAVYAGTLLLPDQPGPVLVGARFTNAVGISEDVTAEVTLVNPPTTGSLTGRVVQGVDDRPQPGLEVMLHEEGAKPDAKAVASAKTNDKGVFTMSGLKPGGYVASTSKPSDYGAKAAQRVTIGASDQPTPVTLSLKR